jgi:hypothetical protein
MTAEPCRRAAPLSTRVTLAWAGRYTRGLPPGVADDRRAELAADLHDHRAAAAAFGLGRAATSRTVVRRMLLGVPADLSWRRDQLRVVSGRPSEATMANRSFSRVQVGITVLALPFLALSLAGAVSVIVGSVTQPGPPEVSLGWGLVALCCAGAISAGLAVQVSRRRAGLVLVAVGVLAVGAMLFWLPPVGMGALLVAALVAWEVARPARGSTSVPTAS